MEFLNLITDKDIGTGYQRLGTKYANRDCDSPPLAKISPRGVIFHPKLPSIATVSYDSLGYSSLIGGDSKPNENPIDGLIREAREEAGLEIEVARDAIGLTIELRRQINMSVISPVFLARSRSENPTLTNLTEDERAAGLVFCWLPLSAAVTFFRMISPLDYVGRFVHKREAAILEHVYQDFNDLSKVF